MSLTLPGELDAALEVAEARQAWDDLPIESQTSLVAFVRDGWFSRTRRRRSATVADLCRQGADVVLAWQAANARFAQAARANDNRGS